MNYKLLEAARTFLRELKTIDEKSFDMTYQRLAMDANDSTFGQALEPLQGLCVAMQAEQKRRLHFHNRAMSHE